MPYDLTLCAAGRWLIHATPIDGLDWSTPCAQRVLGTLPLGANRHEVGLCAAHEDSVLDQLGALFERRGML